jgi:DNA-directed RNA polymerase specialized sigma24 family protein
VDDKEYQRIRTLMRASVLRVWRKDREVIAGTDPWDVVDEAWASMALKNFACEGPFLAFALRVAKNKAVDSLRRAEVKRADQSLDAPPPTVEDGPLRTLHEDLSDSKGADVDYLRGLDDEAVAEKLALAEEAIYRADVLTEIERHVLLAVRVDERSRAAVGRELDPPLTGQGVGQIAARAFMKVQAFVKEHERPNEESSDFLQLQGGGSGGSN